MEQDDFSGIAQALQTSGPAAAFHQLAEILRHRKEWHNLFDCRMLQKKSALGLPLNRPSSLQDVPPEYRKEVEATYLEAAREVANEFLRQGDLPSAWMYFQAIREPEKMAAALDKLPDTIGDYDRLDKLLQIALFQGAHPEKGVRMMLKGHGTCSTITALDQVLPQFTPRQRSNCAKILVRTVHDDLTESVRRHVEQRLPLIEPGLPLTDLIAGREWLFEGGNYHVDVSHLSSVVRFARSIEQPAPEIELAAELALYGSRLDRQYQYAGEPPFSDFYTAHLHFLNAILNRNREAGLQYFRDQLANEPDEQDKPLLAYVLVDLLIRCERLEEAVDVATQHLATLGDDAAISLDDLCTKAGRLDTLINLRRTHNNLVGYTSALIQKNSEIKS